MLIYKNMYCVLTVDSFFQFWSKFESRVTGRGGQAIEVLSMLGSCYSSGSVGQVRKSRSTDYLVVVDVVDADDAATM